MTVYEIQKALEQHIERTKNIKYGARKKTLVDAELLKDILDLINRQQAENEALQMELEVTRDNLGDTRAELNSAETEIERLQNENNQFADIGKMYSEIKSEAIKELADSVKKKAEVSSSGYIMISELRFDNLVKERVGEKNEIQKETCCN